MLLIHPDCRPNIGSGAKQTFGAYSHGIQQVIYTRRDMRQWRNTLKEKPVFVAVISAGVEGKVKK